MSDTKKLKDLIPDDRNANKGTPRGQAMIRDSIHRSKYGRSILIDRNNKIVGGNKTVEAAAEVSGVEAEIVIVETDGDKLLVHKRNDLDLSDPDPNNPARQLAFADNFTNHFSFTLDPDVTIAEMESGFDFESIGVTVPDLEEMLGSAGVLNGKEEGRDTPPEVDKAEQLQGQWQTRVGQVWQLGDHRLVCGDSTKQKSVDAVVFGKAKFIFADPPYGVNYADKNKSLNAVAFGNRIQTPILNDHMTTEDTARNIWLPAFKQLYRVAEPGCVYYCTAPQGGDQMMMMMMMIAEAQWLVKHELIWVKNNHVLGRADYHYQHEPLIYGWKPGAAHYFIDSRSEVSVWEIDKPLNSDLHPTEKPLELVEKAMRNSSRPGDVCADFFAGIGTTIIAAENLGRKAMCIDLDPNYIAVSLQRWSDHTGKTPVLIDRIDT